MIANILPADPLPPTLGMGSVGQNSTSSEHGRVAYQIKENQECRNIVANILPAEPPSPQTLGMGSVGQNSTFSEHGRVTYPIKKNKECRTMVANNLPADTTPLTLGMGSVGQISTFLGYGHVAYQIKENHESSKMVASRPDPTHPDPGDGASRSKFNFFRTWSCCIAN